VRVGAAVDTSGVGTGDSAGAAVRDTVGAGPGDSSGAAVRDTVGVAAGDSSGAAVVTAGEGTGFSSAKAHAAVTVPRTATVVAAAASETERAVRRITELLSGRG
jgi:hypothetical protein